MAKASQLRSRGFESRCGFVGAAVHQYGHSQRRVEGWRFCVRPPSEESGGLEVSCTVTLRGEWRVGGFVYGHTQRRVEGWRFCVRPHSEESGGLEVLCTVTLGGEWRVGG